jgi:pimeloyl-ACP methyl ester carboxylesterase
MSFIKSNGKNIYFEHYESKNGKNIFAIPGHKSGITKSMTLKLLRDLALKNGYGFISFDLAGYHNSEGEAKFWQLEEWLQNALDVYDEVNTENNIIIGSSMGGYLSLAFSMLHQDKIIGLIGLVPGFGTTFREHRSDKPFIEDFAGKVKININTQDADLSFNFIDSLIDIDVPYLALTGLKDDVVSYKSSLKIVENIKSSNAQALITKEGTHSTSAVDNMHMVFDFIEHL